MTHSDLVEAAIALAHRAHEGQVDKAGAPYIEHPMRVMASMPDDVHRIAAILHDVVEDTDVTLDDLEALGIPHSALTAIDALTKRRGEPYETYLERVMRDPVAVRVKIADVTDNMDLGRIPSPTERDRVRLEKYRKVRPRLQAALRQLEG